jgi:hypothetical protein
MAQGKVQKFKDDQAQAATRGFLEDLFDDYYKHRYKVYKMNFVRGIVFGFGSVIGGTLMIAVLLWALSFLSEIPFVGRFTQTIQHSIETTKPTRQQ